MKIAVIGAGHWGINLVRNLYALEALSHVVETNSETIDAVTEEISDIPFLNNYDALLNSDIDAVAIATPTPTHYAIALKFLEIGKDVFIEKPMTISTREAEELVRVAEANQRILMIGHILLYQPAIEFIKNYLDQNHLGEIYHLHQERLKLGRVRSVENVIWSLGIHDIAVLLYLVGSSPEKVDFIGHCGIQEQIEDDAYVHMTFDQGAIAHLHCSWIWPENKRSLKIIGEKGMLIYDELKQTVVLHKKRIGSDLENIDGGEELLFEGSDQPLRLEMEHFIQCISSREKPISDGRSGLEVVRVTESLSKN
ncbi:MAG: Gfo/Idh/MocA family oxidoreductase [Verrucomicrobiota bacterium]|nr:Gfo/Idh/MocA family oxidoreductase [Verrucomicrobiota bacterium]MEE2808163.1 Gfo/Idh/MocA family oxidoreductase [Verrucomicrobiota bacterium]